jgi:predicted polyphosphate/ATP-dependent NAD kinase
MEGSPGRPDEPRRLGLLVNPIAGMGGRVGLKGTDGVVDRAIELGAEPSAPARAREMLGELGRLLTVTSPPTPIRWLTCSGPMGASCLSSAGFEDYSILHEPGPTTSAADTGRAVEAMVGAGAELIVFCGGDGTARDVCRVTGLATPILGIPAGVKMYSGVFGVTPARTAQILAGYLRGDLELATVEVLDIDEERYRRGEWSVRLHAMASTPFEPSLTQSAKALLTGVGERQAAEEIADDVVERLTAEPGTLVLLGPGSTVEAVADRLGVDKTLLGVDAVVDGRRIGVDLDERRLLDLVGRHRRSVLVLSPIGAQGFVLGRGNQQLSPAVVGRIGLDNVVVVATPAKLQRTPVLRVDTGDGALDAAFATTGYREVVIGYHLSRLVRVVP